MQKQELLDHIERQVRAKALTKAEVLDAANRGLNDAASHSLRLSEILYYIGGGIVVLGIVILVAQQWSVFNPMTKIIVTLGSGIAAYLAGVAFMRDEKLEKVAQAFFFISALVMPVGLFVTFDQTVGYDTSSPATNVLVSALLFAMFFTSFLAFRKNVFLLFSILFATWLFFAVTSWLAAGQIMFFFEERWRFYAYRVAVAGLSYILLGHHFKRTGREEFTGFLYGFGILGFLGAALALGGWSPNASVLWEILYPGIVFGVMFLSIHLKAKSFLVFGAIFLMLYILKITAEYFQEGLGWPLSLVLAGFALIAVGYGAVYLNRKYLAKA